MDSFQLFTISIHQVFFGLLALSYCLIALIDSDELKEENTQEKRHYLALVFSILFLGLSISFWESWREIGMFFAVEFAFFIIFGLFSPKYAAGFFIFLLLTRPWETYDNQLMETMPRDYFYVVALSLLGHKILKRKLYFRFNWGSLLSALFAIWVLLSAVFSNHYPEAISKYVEIFSKGIIAFFLIQNCFDRSKDLLSAKLAFVFAIIEMGVISAWNTFFSAPVSIGEEGAQRLESVGILSNSNDIAAVLVLALPFCLFLFLRKGAARYLWPFAVFTGGGIVALIWSSQSRGALLAVFACAAAYGFTLIKSKKMMALIAVISLVCAIGSFSLLKRSGGDLDGSSSNRMIYWKAGANMAARNPLFGVGFWGFNQNFPLYAIDGNTGTEGKQMTAHSAWVQVLAENGPIGFLFFFGLWWYALFCSWRSRASQPEYFVSLVGYGVAISFLSHGYQLYPYILLSLAITQSFLALEEKNISLSEPVFNYGGVA